MKLYKNNLELLNYIKKMNVFFSAFITCLLVCTSTFAQTQAEDYDNQSGVQLSNGGTSVGFIDGGDWIQFEDFNFGNGATSITANLAKGNNGTGTVEFRTGSLNGTLLGQIAVTNTGGWGNFQSISTSISSISGTQDLYLVFVGGSNLLDIDWFEFIGGNTSFSAFSQIEAENYNDESGTQLSNGGISIGFIDTGDWIKFENVDFDLGASTVTANLSKGNNGTGIVEFRTGSVNGILLGQVQITNTGGWNNFQEITASITNVSGNQDLYLVFTGNLDVDWIQFSTNTNSSTISAFAQIEAEDYDDESGIQLTNSNQAVGYIDTGDWIKFENVDFGSGANAVIANVANGTSAIGSIEFRQGSLNGTLLGQLQVAPTSSWTDFGDVTTTLSNANGTDDLYLVFTGGLDIDWMQFGVHSAYSQIQGEDFDDQSGIQLSNGGSAVGYIDTGDWIKFNDVALGSNVSSVVANVSKGNSGTGTIAFREGSITGTLLGEIQVNSTGSWTNFQSISGAISNANGVSDLYLVFTGGLDVDWIELSNADNSGNQVFSITSPLQYQVFQRNDLGRADILIEGQYTGDVSGGLEARWNDSGAWEVMTINGNGTFSGALSNEIQGQGTLNVRLIDDTSITASVTYVGIGDIFIITGQSNASGRGRDINSYFHPTLKAGLFGNDDNWKEAVDPMDDNTNDVDNVSGDPGARGTPFILSTTDIMATENIPVAWVPCAKGGSRMSGWIPTNNHGDASTLYGSMFRRINAIGGKAKGVVYYQGEGDANDLTTQSAYESMLNTFVNAVASDFPGLQVMVGQVGPSNDYLGLDAIRAAQQAVIESNPNALRGPITYDMDLTDFDGLHYRETVDIVEFARRWTFAIDQEFYGGSFGFGPIIQKSNVTYNTASNTITVPFSSETSPAISSLSSVSGVSFDLYNGNQLVTVSSVSVSGNSVLLTPASNLNTSQSITLTYGSLIDAVNNAIYDDNQLPAQTFYNVPVSVFGADNKTVEDSKIISSDSNYLIYPNPAYNNINVIGVKQGEIISIYNVMGVRVLESNKSKNISISNLESGLYIIHVGQETYKFLKH